MDNFSMTITQNLLIAGDSFKLKQYVKVHVIVNS